MPRQCYNCSRNIEDEPAIQGINGLLCFPCRYRFDAAGGEQFALDSKKCERELPIWEREHGQSWRTKKKLQRMEEACYVVVMVAMYAGVA